MNINGFEERDERNEDRRIRKTKKALRAALVRLLSRKSVAEITIKELTEEADVHRGTFYHHYRDAFDLKEQLEQEIRQELQQVLDSVSDSQMAQGPYPLLVRALSYLEENRDVARMLVSEAGCPEMLTAFCDRLSGRCMGSALFGEQLRYGNRFCAAGLQGMITAWVDDRMRMPPQEMARVMETMMMGTRLDSSRTTE